MQQAADFHVAGPQGAFGKAHVFGTDRERLRAAAEALGQFAANHVGGADEFGDECGGRFHIKVARGVDLFDAALVEHGHAVGHRQRFGLVVGHEDERDAELALQLFQLALHLFAQLKVEGAQRFI